MKLIKFALASIFLLFLTPDRPVSAATSSGTIAFSGTLATMVTCTFAVPSSLQLGRIDNNVSVYKNFAITVNCPEGTAYTIETSPNIPVTIGSATNYISILDTLQLDIAYNVWQGQGLGAPDNIQFKLNLHGGFNTHSPPAANSVGSFSVVVPFTITY